VKRFAALGASTVVSLAVLSGQTSQTPPTQSQQRFRTATDAVIVDASVRAGGKMVSELSIADFELTDNGVKQAIESVEQSSVPIDLTLVVDTSGNPAGPFANWVDKKKVAHAIDAEVRQVANLLRPADRLRVLAIDRYVRQINGFTPVSALGNVRLAEIGGLGSVYDTLTAALLHDVEPWRRHVVVTRTKGRDSMSSVSAKAVGAIAERSDALVHLVLMETAMDNEEVLHDFQATNMGLAWQTHRFWLPADRRLIERTYPLIVGEVAQPTIHPLTLDGRAIQDGVRAGGGDWHQTLRFSEPNLVSTFRRVFEEHRQGYVLRYTPRGVTASGWHTINVTVPKIRGAVVKSRRGYGIEPPSSEPAAAPIPAIPRTLPDLIRAYDAGAFQSASNGFRQVADAAKLMKDFDEGGNPWPAKPRREAAFAVELAEPGLFSSRAPVRDQAEALLVRHARFIRHPLEPQEFERLWHYAVLTLLQATLRPNVLDAFAARAIERFPDEPRFLLARAIAADQRSAAGGALRWTSANPAMTANVEAAKALYELVLTRPEVSTEARIRLAFLLHRLGKQDEALTRLDEAGARPIEDGMLRYLHQLFRGKVLAQLNRLDESLAAYRAAQAIIPSAQSARVSIMNTLYRQGDRAGAEALAEQIQTEPLGPMDPWWIYWQGQYRVHGQVMARLREVTR
jgi:tetratricopeptide (TPR) repeat protein